MSHFKIALFILTISLSAVAQAAEWRGIVQRAGFMGRFALGASYEWQPEHAVDFSVGLYQISNNNYYQANFSYRYSRWNIPFFGHQWRPIQMGAFTVISLDNDRYFYKSPSKYPESNYYDSTIIRYGAEFGSTFTFMPIGIGLGYHIRIFDTGLIAAFNNSNRDLQYYISSGISLQYLF